MGNTPPYYLSTHPKHFLQCSITFFLPFSPPMVTSKKHLGFFVVPFESDIFFCFHSTLKFRYTGSFTTILEHYVCGVTAGHSETGSSVVSSRKRRQFLKILIVEFKILQICSLFISLVNVRYEKRTCESLYHEKERRTSAQMKIRCAYIPAEHR